MGKTEILQREKGRQTTNPRAGMGHTKDGKPNHSSAASLQWLEVVAWATHTGQG